MRASSPNHLTIRELPTDTTLKKKKKVIYLFGCTGSSYGMYGMDLMEAEDIKKRWQEYTEELYQKKIFMTQITMMV